MKFRVFPLLCLAAVLLTSSAAFSQNISLQLANGVFRANGWTAPRSAPAAGWGSIFAVYAGSGNIPPLLGDYTVESGTLVFRPKFPLSPGMRYRANFHAPGIAAAERVFDGPPRDTTPRTRVEHVYPSADVLPSNLLRFYIYFSAPMTQGQAGRRIHLLDEKGKDLNAAFLPGEELWDPASQRLTMTLDPGRIKRGLTSNQAMGPPIVEGKRYRLVVDQDWPDARDVRMTEGFVKAFRGGPAVRIKPDPKQWRITAPKAGSGEALIVGFPRPMNYVLLQRMLQVERKGAKLTGDELVERNEMQWRFAPRDPWRDGEYQLVVNTALEDLAGNSIALAFDIDVFEKVTEHIATATIAVPFTIR